jgi:hypothetical protein
LLGYVILWQIPEVQQFVDPTLTFAIAFGFLLHILVAKCSSKNTYRDLEEPLMYSQFRYDEGLHP